MKNFDLFYVVIDIETDIPLEWVEDSQCSGAFFKIHARGLPTIFGSRGAAHKSQEASRRYAEQNGYNWGSTAVVTYKRTR